MPKVYFFGIPGRIGGAATKIRDLLMLLKDSLDICVVLNSRAELDLPDARSSIDAAGVELAFEEDLPNKMDGVALVICQTDLFTSGRAQRIKERGLKLFLSNEMMWPFTGEEEAVKAGLIDRVLFVSKLQSGAFSELYHDIPSFETGNYVDARRFKFVERQREDIVVGRLSRPDPDKYSEDFPTFYEALKLPRAKYHVMAWSDALHKKYCWHEFGDQWALFGAGVIPTDVFLQRLDLFVYTLGPLVKESWGRSVVEAMLTGAIPLVPTGHNFDALMESGSTGYICNSFDAFFEAANRLYSDIRFRRKVSVDCADYARKKICNPDTHRKLWMKCLTS